MNLNQTKEQRVPVERFNPARPQGHPPTLYRPSFGAMFAIFGAIVAAVAMMVLTIATVANGGTFPDLNNLGHGYRKYVKGDEGEKVDAKGRVLNNEEQLKVLLSDFKEAWNAGWEYRPLNVFTADYKTVNDTQKTSGTNLAADYIATTKINQVHLDSYALYSDEKGVGEATFLLLRRQPLWDWDESVKDKSGFEREVIIEQGVRYSIIFEKSQGGAWKIAQLTWLEKTPVRIKEVNDLDAETIVLPENGTGFTEMRPTKEAMQARYDAMATKISGGQFPFSDVYSNYKIVYPATVSEDGTKTAKGERSLQEVAARIKKLYGNSAGVSLVPTVEGLSQFTENQAVVIVSYRMTIGTSRGNTYTFAWKDRDFWQRLGSGNAWYLGRTERPRKSVLRDYFAF